MFAQYHGSFNDANYLTIINIIKIILEWVHHLC